MNNYRIYLNWFTKLSPLIDNKYSLICLAEVDIYSPQKVVTLEFNLDELDITYEKLLKKFSVTVEVKCVDIVYEEESDHLLVKSFGRPYQAPYDVKVFKKLCRLR